MLIWPGAVIGGWAAGLVHGVEDIDGGHDLSLEPFPVTVLLPPGQHRRSIPGVTHRQSRDKVESVEVRTRLYCELEAGYPPLLVNEPVSSLSGQLLGIPDLLDEQAGVAIEYDGARWLDGRGHREVAQHRDDTVREERFERTGLIVVRVDSSDLTKHRLA